MNKQANIQKAIELMKSQGMSAENALKTFYPDWDDAKIQQAAMTIRSMDKTAAVMQVSSAMAELEKEAAALLSIPAAIGATAGALHAPKGRKLEGATRGAVGGLAGSVGFMAPLPPTARIAAGLGTSVLAYSASMKSMFRPKHEPVKVGGGTKTASAEKKITFSPAMDKSPLLKGKQSKLPDQVQAKILEAKTLKGKMKNEQPIKDKMASAVSLIGLQYASNAMYANHVRKVTGQEKTANAFMKLIGAPATASWATRGGLMGGLAGGAGEATRLFRLANTGKAGKVGKGLATKESVKANKAFLKNYKAQGGVKGGALEFLKANPKAAFDLAGGSIGKNALTGGLTGAAAGAAAAKGGQAMARSKAIATAKKVAVPAAIGAGGYALLS
jgi:hypothetical protein